MEVFRARRLTGLFAGHIVRPDMFQVISLYIIALLIIAAFMISSGFQIDESIASGVSFLSNSGVIATEYGTNTTIISNFSQSLRFICAFAMLLGRLEFVAIVIILIKMFRKD